MFLRWLNSPKHAKFCHFLPLTMPTAPDHAESLSGFDWRAARYTLIHELNQTPDQAQRMIDLDASKIFIRLLISQHKKLMPLLDEEERNELRKEILNAFKMVMDDNPQCVDRRARMEFVELMKEDLAIMRVEDAVVPSLGLEPRRPR